MIHDTNQVKLSLYRPPSETVLTFDQEKEALEAKENAKIPLTFQGGEGNRDLSKTKKLKLLVIGIVQKFASSANITHKNGQLQVTFADYDSYERDEKRIRYALKEAFDSANSSYKAETHKIDNIEKPEENDPLLFNITVRGITQDIAVYRISQVPEPHPIFTPKEAPKKATNGLTNEAANGSTNEATAEEEKITIFQEFINAREKFGKLSISSFVSNKGNTVYIIEGIKTKEQVEQLKRLIELFDEKVTFGGLQDYTPKELQSKSAPTTIKTEYVMTIANNNVRQNTQPSKGQHTLRITVEKEEGKKKSKHPSEQNTVKFIKKCLGDIKEKYPAQLGEIEIFTPPDSTSVQISNISSHANLKLIQNELKLALTEGMVTHTGKDSIQDNVTFTQGFSGTTRANNATSNTVPTSPFAQYVI